MGIEINDVEPRIQYTPNVAQVVFTIPFEFYQDADIKIYFDDNTTAESSGYTLVGANSNGTKEVTFSTAPETSGVTKLTIERDTGVARSTNFTTSSDWTADNVNDEYNRLTMMIAEREEIEGRTIVRPVQSAETYALIWPDGATSVSQQVMVDTVNGISLASATGAVWSGGDGTVAAPYYTFAADPDTGFYRIGSGSIGISKNGVTEGEVVGTTGTQTLTGKTLDDDTNEIHANVTYTKVRNVSGGELGTSLSPVPVYVTGHNAGQDRVTVDKADANDPAKMPCIGLIEGVIANNTNGHCIGNGVFDSLDTTGTNEGEVWSVGDALYVSMTAGALTNVRPTGASEEVQTVATVIRAHASSGRVLVQGSGRSNDTPNVISAVTLFAGPGSGFGIAPTDGTLHVHTASAGAVTANVSADDLVVEASGAGGISILVPDAVAGTVSFGSPSDNVGANIQHNYSAGTFQFASGAVGHSVTFKADDNVLNLTLSGAAGSELAEFVGDLTVAGTVTYNGPVVQVNATNWVSTDFLIELNNAAVSNANDMGIIMERGSTGDNAFMGWDESDDGFVLGTTTATGSSTGNLTIIAAPLTVAALTATSLTFGGAVINTIEEVSFTPTWTPQSGAVTSYTTQEGSATILGKRVDWSCRIKVNILGTASGNMTLDLDTLPNCENIDMHGVKCTWSQSIATAAGNNITGYMQASTNTALMNAWDSTSGTTTLQANEITDGGDMMVSGSYMTA